MSSDPTVKMYDILDDVETLVECYDGKGSVSLVDCTPRLCPEGRDISFAAARSARVSYGASLKTPAQDRSLVRYLILNNHTSPLEFISFTFRIKCPIFVARHIMRHRTTSINEVSARYTILDDNYFSLSDVRVNNKTNKQGSGSSLPVEESIEAKRIHEESCKQSMEAYDKLLKMGVARELARTVLPCGTFTEFYLNINLNNLLKFLSLRMAEDAQEETREVACAMFSLCSPLSNTIFDTYANTKRGIFLTRDEAISIRKNSTTLVVGNGKGGKKEHEEYIRKLDSLNIEF